jgi:hypothetical protein
MFDPAIASSSQPVAYTCNPVVVFLTDKLIVVRFCPACGVIVTVAILYGNNDAEPFVVSARAAPPSVAATWKSFAVALTTK